MKLKAAFALSLLSVVAFQLSGCSSKPKRSGITAINPKQDYHPLSTRADSRFNREKQPSVALQNNACLLLEERPHWRRALKEVRKNWGVEPWYILAFLHQESRFNPTAMSTSKAYGYAQVKDESWDWYQEKIGHVKAKRDRFDDAVDFIGFYATKNVERNKVNLNDVKRQYLAYHEGMGGYERGTHKKKPWLLEVSDKVVDRAAFYQAQLIECPIK